MEIKNIVNGENDTVVIIPTISIEKNSRLIDMYNKLNMDIIFIEDSGDNFNFSNSVNAGINKALTLHYKIIGFANDDVIDLNFKNLDTFYKLFKIYDAIFPIVKNKKVGDSITSNSLIYLLKHTLINKSPFFALKTLKEIKTVSHALAGKNKVTLITPTIFYNYSVMPISFFVKSFIVKNNINFNSDFQNGCEDTDFNLRYLKNCKKILYGNCIHIGGLSFKNTNFKNNYIKNIRHKYKNLLFFSLLYSYNLYGKKSNEFTKDYTINTVTDVIRDYYSALYYSERVYGENDRLE